jgi:HSP20 family protein
MRIKNSKNPFFITNLMEEMFSVPDSDRKVNYNSDISENRPPANFIETKGDYQYELSTPGFSKEDIMINLNDNIVTIRGEKTAVNTNSGRDYISKEFHSQKFHRELNVPEGIILDEINAKSENGITTLYFPKERIGKTKNINREIDIN